MKITVDLAISFVIKIITALMVSVTEHQSIAQLDKQIVMERVEMFLMIIIIVENVEVSAHLDLHVHLVTAILQLLHHHLVNQDIPYAVNLALH